MAEPARVFISEAENARLIRACAGRTLHLEFGPRGVWLAPGCEWPIPLPALWRGVAFADGGGI